MQTPDPAPSGAPRPRAVFKFYPTCKLVRGGAFSAIYDLERRRIFRFTSAFDDLFAVCETEGLDPAELDGLEPGARAQAQEALAFLKDREIGRFMDPVSARSLAPLSERWDAPHLILSAIVDVADREPDWDVLIPALDARVCRGLQVRCFSGLMSPNAVEAVLERLAGRRIGRVEFLVRWSEAWEAADWTDLFARHRNLQIVRIHGSPDERDIDTVGSAALRGRVIRFESAPIDGPQGCGVITRRTLAMPTTALFGELKGFNGCLNRKVSVRSDGEICNCPSMKRTFGRDLSRLTEIMASPEFQAPWAIRKDEIDVCKGCEFRYVCTDCRAHLDSDVSTMKPARCGYDPLTGEWGTVGTAKSGAELGGYAAETFAV